jgi:hypothetical protein
MPEIAEPKVSTNGVAPKTKLNRKKGKLKKSKEISRKSTRPYPAASLSSALEVAQKIKINGGNPWPPSEIANALGLSPKTNSFYYLTAAARDFGLTVGTRDTDTISLTDLGRSIVYAPSLEVEREKKIDAFNKIEIFNKVLNHYHGSSLPEMKYLANTLESTFGLAPEHHEEFSRLFQENCRYLDISAGEPSANNSLGTPPTVIVGQPSKKSGFKAFVIMPFNEDKTPHRPKGFFTEVLNSLITPAALEAKFNVETANRQGSDVIQSTIVNQLLDADLVIADLTDHNPNVMIELGLRLAENKPVALIKATGTGDIFDVDNMLRVFEYDPNLWRTTVEANLSDLTKHITAAWENRASDQSYIKILRKSPAHA